MVQIVSNTDKREALLQKLTHARSAKQKQPKNHIVLARVLDQFLRRRSLPFSTRTLGRSGSLQSSKPAFQAHFRGGTLLETA
jgi:hypothetical protein